MPTLHKTGANFLNVEVDFVLTPALLQSVPIAGTEGI